MYYAFKIAFLCFTLSKGCRPNDNFSLDFNPISLSSNNMFGFLDNGASRNSWICQPFGQCCCHIKNLLGFS